MDECPKIEENKKKNNCRSRLFSHRDNRNKWNAKKNFCTTPHVNLNLEESNREVKSKIDPIYKAPLTDSLFANIYLTEIPMNRNFLSFLNQEKKSVMHLKAIARQRKSIIKTRRRSFFLFVDNLKHF